MFVHYLKLGLRNLRRHRFHAGLNILGLALGLTSSVLIGLYIYDELTFDQFHKDYKNIYRVGLHLKIGGQEFIVESTSAALAHELATNVPGVYEATRMNGTNSTIVRYGDKVFNESKLVLGDTNFFQFFSFNMLEGSPKTVLKDPHSIVLTRETATKYFGTESAIDKIMVVGDQKENFKVTGIVEKPPFNSHIHFDMVVSAESDKMMREGAWGDGSGLNTYYKKDPNTTIASIEQKLRQSILTHIVPDFESGIGENFTSFEKKGGIYKFFSYSLASSHLLHPEIIDGNGSDIKYIYILSGVGIFILLIACINFMNLSTARSAGRAKEVGLRKTLGSANTKLIAQFLCESFIYVAAAVIVSMIAVYLLLPSFNLLSGKELAFDTLLSPVAFAGLLVIIVVIGLFAGSYPAFYLTSFHPVDVLKGNVTVGLKTRGIRSALVVVQFTISIALIISTLIVRDQLNYMQQINLGLDKQNVLVLEGTKRLANNTQAFANLLRQQSDILKTSYVDHIFPNMAGTYHFPGSSRDIILTTHFTDPDYKDVMKLEMKEGRYFSEAVISDSTACIVNEAAVREFGWKDPLNQRLATYNNTKLLKVIGVVKDFNYESFKSKIKPLVLQMSSSTDNLLIRYTGDSKAMVATVEKLWKKTAVNEPFEYTFMDENFNKLFQEEQRLGKLFTVMTTIAIMIACLGLLGLASFIAEQRTKEIGIRKILGASVASINALLSREFMVLVAIAFVIACGITWYLMASWLNTFAYRIEPGYIQFLLGGLAAAGIAWLTVSYHFLKAAKSNPAETLRSE